MPEGPMKPIALSKSTARRLILQAQMLDGSAARSAGTEGLERVFDQLGYVQIDTIHIVERAHHHVLWTRRPGYEPGMLHTLQAVERRVFEYWAHAMAYLPMSDYRFYLYKMRNFRDPKHPWLEWLSSRKDLPLDLVRKRIREEGALDSKSFSRPGGKKRGTWWDWKPAKNALELLFWQGELMVAERRNFEKVYDLTERVLPSGVDTRMPSEREMAEFLIRRALSAMSAARTKEIFGFLQPTLARDSAFRAVPWNVLIRTLGEMVEAGEIHRAQIDGEEGEDYYLLAETAERMGNGSRRKPRVRILSPFDNLIIQRRRMQALFGFDYSLECFLPAARRKYGYFVLPVLYGDRLVGRVDPKADRKSGKMILQSVYLEDGFTPTGDFLGAFAQTLVEFAAFNRCGEISVGRTRPAKFKAAIHSALKARKNHNRSGRSYSRRKEKT
jgi:uncharacterized protein YcaQ